MLSRWANAFETAVISEKPTPKQLLEARDMFWKLTKIPGYDEKTFNRNVKAIVTRTVKRIFQRKMFRTSATSFLCMKRAHNVPKDVIRIIVALDQQNTRKKLVPFIERLCGANSRNVQTNTDLNELWEHVRLAMKLYH